VHQIGESSDRDLLLAGLSFFEYSTSEQEESQDLSFTLPTEVFQTLYRGQGNNSEDDTAETIPEQAFNLLHEDVNNQTLRGIILAIHYDENCQPEAKQGTFVLKGRERIWLFIPQYETKQFRAQLLTPKTFAQAVQKMLMTVGPERQE